MEPRLTAPGCHLPYMESHSVTCHPAQVNTPRHNLSQTGRYSIYLLGRDGRLSWPRWKEFIARIAQPTNTGREPGITKQENTEYMREKFNK